MKSSSLIASNAPSGKAKPRFSITLFTDDDETPAPPKPRHATEAELNRIALPPAPCRPKGVGYPGVGRMFLMTEAMLGDGKEDTLMGAVFALNFFAERGSWAPARYDEWVAYMAHSTVGSRGPDEVPTGFAPDEPLGLRNPYTLVRSQLLTCEPGNSDPTFAASAMLVQAYATALARYPAAKREYEIAQWRASALAVTAYRAETAEPSTEREIEIAEGAAYLVSVSPNHPWRRDLRREAPAKRPEPVQPDEESAEPADNE